MDEDSKTMKHGYSRRKFLAQASGAVAASGTSLFAGNPIRGAGGFAGGDR